MLTTEHKVSLLTVCEVNDSDAGAANRCLVKKSTQGFREQKTLGSHMVRKRLALTLSAFTLQAH